MNSAKTFIHLCHLRTTSFPELVFYAALWSASQSTSAVRAQAFGHGVSCWASRHAFNVNIGCDAGAPRKQYYLPLNMFLPQAFLLVLSSKDFFSGLFISSTRREPELQSAMTACRKRLLFPVAEARCQN